MAGFCSIPGCLYNKISYRRTFQFDRKPALFSVPKNPATREKWAKVFSFIIGKPLKNSHRICEFHFKEDDMPRYTKKILLSDGTEFCMEKAHLGLKKGAYPTIFFKDFPKLNEKRSTTFQKFPHKRKKINVKISDSGEIETSEFVIENTQNTDSTLNSDETSNFSSSSTINFIQPHTTKRTTTNKLQSFVVPSTNLSITKGKQNVLLLTTPQNKQNVIKTPLLLANIVNDKRNLQDRQNIDNNCAGIIISTKDKQSVSGPQANRENSSRPNNSVPPILVTTIPQNRINAKQSKQVLPTDNKWQLLKRKPPMILDISPPGSKRYRAILPKNNHNNPQSSTILRIDPKNLSNVVSLESLLQHPDSKVYQVSFKKGASSNNQADSNKDKIDTYSKSSPLIEKVFSSFDPVQNAPPSISHVPDSMDDSPEPFSNEEFSLNSKSSPLIEKVFSSLDPVQNVPRSISHVQDNMDDSPESLSNEEFSLNFLKSNLSKINTCNSLWKVNGFDNFILCCRFTPDYKIERRVIIEEDLSVKVFLKEILTAIGKNMKVNSIDAVSKLIYKVERSIFCSRIDENESTCQGYLQSVVECKRKNLCLGCIELEKLRDFEEEQRVKEEKKFEEHVELLRFHFKI